MWIELRTDTTSGWRNADSLRKHLKLDYTALFPDKPTLDDPRSTEELQAVRNTSARALDDLVLE